MQRWLFFIILFPVLLLGQAPKPDILRTEVSLWMAGKQANTNPEIINATAVITFKTIGATKIVKLNAKGIDVKSVRKREGRDKQALLFHMEDGFLSVELSENTDAKTQVVVDYTFDWSTERYRNYVLQNEGFMAFNSFNATENIAAGQPGNFYPSLAGDASVLLLNVTFLKDRNGSFPGTLNLATDNQDGTKSQFWTSAKPLKPEAFYLIIGSFREFDADDLEEEFELGEVALKNIKLQKRKEGLEPALAFFDLQPEALTDSEYALVDSLSTLKTVSFFITGSEPALDLKIKELHQIKAVALFLESNDTSKASERLWLQLVQKKGESWKNDILQEKWDNRAELNLREKRRLVDYRLKQWKGANGWLEGLDQTRLDTGFVNPFQNLLREPEIKISYRYVSGDTALFVKFVQDTTVAPVYQLPVRVSAYSRDTVKEELQWIDAVSGQLKIRFEESPSAARVDFGTYFPGLVDEEKPDVYLLFQLGRAETAMERKKALQGLFKTKNLNLFSTALGIAMRDEDASLRLLALQNAENLNVPAQQKLKDGLIKLMDDPSSAVSQKAKELVQKYYPDK